MQPINTMRYSIDFCRRIHYDSIMGELTPNEVKALAHLSEGRTYADIACVLRCEESVVKNILLRVRVKMGALNGAHAVAIALREKIIA
jgi:DNA-binding CsgD family transcriptional regulator